MKTNLYLVQYKEEDYVYIFLKILEKAREEGDPDRFICINLGDKNKAILAEDCYLLVQDDISLIMKKTIAGENIANHPIDEVINLFKNGIDGNIRIIK